MVRCIVRKRFKQTILNQIMALYFRFEVWSVCERKSMEQQIVLMFQSLGECFRVLCVGSVCICVCLCVYVCVSVCLCETLLLLQVTAVDLSGLHLHKLTNMDQLRNLRWLCIADNNLTSIEVNLYGEIYDTCVGQVMLHLVIQTEHSQQ